MPNFYGKSEPPPFTEEDLEEIEERLKDDYEGITQDDSNFGRENLAMLCHMFRDGLPLERSEWHVLREWTRLITSQQMKTDMFRLLKAVTKSD